MCFLSDYISRFHPSLFFISAKLTLFFYPIQAVLGGKQVYPLRQVTSLLRCYQEGKKKETTIFSGAHTPRQFRGASLPNVYVFVVWEESEALDKMLQWLNVKHSSLQVQYICVRTCVCMCVTVLLSEVIDCWDLIQEVCVHHGTLPVI